MAAPSYKFTPLYGCMDRGPLCYALQIGDCTLLLDCGWDECFSEELVEPLREWAPRIDAVILSHCSLAHLGALPYAAGKLGLKAPIYGTLPVQKMGSLLMYDQCLGRMNEGDSSLFDLDDVDAIFNHMHSLRFQQSLQMTGKCEAITVTPYCAGHTLGGAVWRIRVGGEDIVYAVDYNHRKERHLNGSSLETHFSRPALMITDAYNIMAVPFDRQTRDRELTDFIMATLRGDGNVLMPMDSGGRMLELLLYLDSFWSDKRVVYPLVLLSYQAYNTVEFAKSQLEWMGDAIARRFERSRDHFNPFETRYLKLMHSTEELEGLPPGPCVVIATTPSLETGLSRELFARWASNPRNAIVFTENTQPNTLSSRVQGHSSSDGPLRLQLKLSKTVPLEGEELEAFQAEQERKLQEQREAMADEEVDKEQQAMSRSSSVVSQGILRAASLKSHSSLSKQAVLELEDGTVDEGVLVDFRIGQPPEDCVAPMFPDEEDEGEEWDDYGCKLDESIAQLRYAGVDSQAVDVVMADEEEMVERPTKVVTTDMEVEVACSVRTFDYEGRSDGRSMRTIVSHVAPRQLVIVHAAKEATERMLRMCSSELQPWKSVCRAPSKGETVDPSPAYPVREVQICNSLWPALTFRDMGGAFMGSWISGTVQAQEEEEAPPLLKPASSGAADTGPGSIFIGDVRLSSVKQALAEAGIQAEFNGGVLVCASSITVQRGAEDGILKIEGALCDDYFRVRDIVYGQYHIC